MPSVPSSGVPSSGVAVATVAVAFGASVAVGQALTRHGLHLRLGDAVPLSGHLDIRLSAATLLPVTVAALLIATLPVAADRLAWRPLLAVCAVASAGWAVSLALVEGVAALGRPISTKAEYLTEVHRVHGLHPFLMGLPTTSPSAARGSRGRRTCRAIRRARC